MRTTLLWILLIGCIILGFCLCKWKIKTLTCKILCVLLLAFVFYAGSDIINMGYQRLSEYREVKEIVNSLDSDIVKMKGSKVYVKIKSEWVKVEDIEVPESFSKKYTIKFDGSEVELNSPEIRNSLTLFRDMGITK